MFSIMAQEDKVMKLPLTQAGPAIKLTEGATLSGRMEKEGEEGCPTYLSAHNHLPGYFNLCSHCLVFHREENQGSGNSVAGRNSRRVP